MSQVTENKVIAAPVPMTPLQEFWHYFKRNKGAVVGLVYVVVMIVIAVFANFLAPYNPADQFRDSLLAPPFWQDGGSMAHLLGTDDVGRDILSRLMYGARLSLLVDGAGGHVAGLRHGHLCGTEPWRTKAGSRQAGSAAFGTQLN